MVSLTRTDCFRELSVGRGSTATLGGGTMPKIHSVEPWDGKDGQVRVGVSVFIHRFEAFREHYWVDACLGKSKHRQQPE